MKIGLGSTRIVFIFSNIVIKLPRLRVLYPLRRFREHRQNGQVTEKLKKFGPTVFTAGLNYFFAGIIANRLEYRYSKNTPSEGIVPINILLWGIIVIQQKGEAVSASSGQWEKFERILRRRGIPEHDTVRSCNFCIFGDRLRMVDYGNQETISALSAGNLKILEQFG